MSLNAFILQLENNYFLYPIYQFISQFLFYVVSKQSGKFVYLLYLPLSLLSFLGTLSKLVTHTSLDRKSKSDGRQCTKIMQAVSQCLNIYCTHILLQQLFCSSSPGKQNSRPLQYITTYSHGIVLSKVECHEIAILCVFLTFQSYMVLFLSI